MTNTPTAQKAGIAADPKTQGRVTPDADHDRVVMASRRADGTPDQTPDFEYIGPKDRVLAAAKQQLAEQAVSAVDVAIRGVSSDAANPGEEGSSAPDAAVQEIKDAHDKAAAAAHKRAEAEVNENHKGLGDK